MLEGWGTRGPGRRVGAMGEGSTLSKFCSVLWALSLFEVTHTVIHCFIAYENHLGSLKKLPRSPSHMAQNLGNETLDSAVL